MRCEICGLPGAKVRLVRYLSEGMLVFEAIQRCRDTAACKATAESNGADYWPVDRVTDEYGSLLPSYRTNLRQVGA